MEPDEGPFRQSERADRSAAAVDALWEAGAVYACDCPREVIDDRTKGNATPGYDRFCRDRGLERTAGALRFRTPDEGEVVVHDLIRGDVVFQCAVHRGLRGGEVLRGPAVRPGQRGRRHRHGDQPRHPG